MTFKEFYLKNLLKESPMRTGHSFEDFLDNDGINVEEAQKIVDDTDPIDVVRKDPAEFFLYRPYDGTDYWLTKQPFIVCNFFFNEIGEGIQFTGVWNHKKYFSSARHLVFEYYLKHYRFVQSDSLHSTQGEAYWKKLVQMAIERGFVVTVQDASSEEEFSYDPNGNYWGREPVFDNFTLRISHK